MIKLKNIKKFKLFGFTIVELMVSISIFTILSSIAYMGYSSYTSNSRDVTRITNLTNIKKALELEKTTSKTLPIPENSKQVRYLGKTIWYNGSIGSGTLSGLNYYVDNLDPKYKDVDFNYSLDVKDNIYELGTILENEGTELPISFLVDKTYAAGNEKTYNFGNFNKLFVKTKINGELHVVSSPSMVLNTNQDYDLVVNEATNLFSINNTNTLPGNYSTYSETGSGTSFTPRLLYKGNKCGVETDEEVVNFISGLNESFSDDIFKNNPDYKFIYDNYDLLRSDITNFSNIEKVGLKINSLLDCNITKFIKTEVFPIKCGVEDGTFEFFKNDFDIKDSCLYSYEGAGTAIVKTGIGNNGSKGVDINVPSGTGKFKYRVFTYAPTKLNFDLKTNLTSGSTVRFYINNELYLGLSGGGTNYNSGYQTFTTPLLPPGIYDFIWDVYRYNGNSSFNLDNINFTCIGGGGTCGWTDNTFENGDKNPWDLFTFAGNSTNTWLQDNTLGYFTEGTYSITNPSYDTNGYINISKTVNFVQSQKFNFDIRTSITNNGRGYNGTLYFYIDGALYNKWDSSSGSNSGFVTFTTPLLSPGNHTFKWTTIKYDGAPHMKMWLDNFRYTCIGGGGTCGWTDNMFENGPLNPWDLFTFEGNAANTWLQDNRPGYFTEGTYSITNPGYDTNGYLHISKTVNFTQAQKFNFDMRTSITNNGRGYNGVIYFYIDGTLYNTWNSTSSSNSGFVTFTTPLLSPGNHTFKWTTVKYDGAPEMRIWLDNFRYTCIGGGGTCGWTDNMFENGPLNPWNLFTFEGNSTNTWVQDNRPGYFTEGTYSITNPGYTTNGYTHITKTINFTQSQKFNFDMRTSITNNSRGYNGTLYFYIDGVLYNTLDSTSSSNSGFITFTTPLLSPGSHTFKWTTIKYDGAPEMRMWLDNFRLSF
ncbi:MAG: prepilin-type N-terminal cleavage/methylation domain-containing protein [Candidatus Gracilibacteria bacterium]|nr:prepilin-type N-terminal cleavage/methylation domain-containing protein [Candidatus Gracilibacteria bacterium]